MFFKRICLSACLLFCFFYLAAQNYSVSYKEKDVKLKFCPKTAFGNQISTEWVGKNGKTPNLVAEAYYVLPKKEKLTIDDISSMARSFSSMEGIQYYSNSKDKYEVLYPECYTVSGEDGKKKIPDITTM